MSQAGTEGLLHIARMAARDTDHLVTFDVIVLYTLSPSKFILFGTDRNA